MTSSHEQTLQKDKRSTAPSLHQKTVSPNIPQKHVLLTNKFVPHHPKAGLNPLVDAAAYLLSIVSKLKQIKSYRNLSKLHQELLEEMNIFQDSVKALGYSSEYVLVSRYALCATLDDIICNTAWGAQGQWEQHSLLATFNQDTSAQPERFFMILERICKDPQLYIDVMELMYICLSLGFKGIYRSTEYSSNQLEQITNSLYKNIRHIRGDFSKILSPFPIRAPGAVVPASKKTSIGIVILFALIAVSLLFASIGQPNLMYRGKALLYGTHES